MSERQQTMCVINCFDGDEPFQETEFAKIGVGFCEDSAIITIDQGGSVLEVGVSPTRARHIAAWLCRIADSIEAEPIDLHDVAQSFMASAAKLVRGAQSERGTDRENMLADAEVELAEARGALTLTRAKSPGENHE